MFAVFAHFPCAGVGVIKWDIKRGEGQSEKAVGAVKLGLNHPVKLEIGFQFRLVQIVFGKAAFFGVVTPIPWLQIAVNAFGMHHFGQFRGVAVGLGFGGFPDGH